MPGIVGHYFYRLLARSQLGFIKYDDYGPKGYIVNNTNIQAGITAESVRWAFTTTHASNWHPVTWLSHMLDCELFGLNASGHHWVNLGFHIANTLLLFIVLRQMTQAVWRSALVAALFGLHPLHVQSVVWISERKDLLSGFFMMLTLWAYAQYVSRARRKGSGESQTSNIEHRTSNAQWCYWSAVLFFALGLMSKPMLVTLPVILLLLDFWPLKRVTRLHSAPARQASDEWRVTRFGLPVPQRSSLNHLLLEKLPFVALSLGSCIATVWAHDQGGAVVSFDRLPWDFRVENSLVSYATYLGKTFWPANLSVFYPYTRIYPGEVVSAGLLLSLFTVYCVCRVRCQPYLLAGWLWFLVMLVPVIGLVQVGQQAIADRYMYLPSIGLFIIVAWGMGGIASISRFWRICMTLGATVMLLACLVDTRFQLRYWRNSITLFSHAIDVTGDNPLISYYLGNLLWDMGNLDEAAKNYYSTLRNVPDFEDAHYRLGYIFLQQKKWPEAEVQFGEVLRLNYNNVNGHAGLGCALAAQDKTTEAEAEYSNALQLKPDDAMIRKALALTTQKAETEKALASLFDSLKTRPTPEIHGQIAAIQTLQGEFQDAVSHYLEALRLRPDSPDVLNNLAWLLATCPDAHIRNGSQAVGYAGRACELTHYHMTPLVGTLAAAYAEAGRFDDAISTAEKACAMASESGDRDLLKRNQDLLALYLKHLPYHESIEKLVPAAP